MVGGGFGCEVVACGAALFAAQFELAVLGGESAFRFAEFELCKIEAHFRIRVIQHDFVEAAFVESRLE